MEKTIKPDCQLTGQNGNIFNLIGVAKRALVSAGMRKEGSEMVNRIITKGEAKSYEEALAIVSEYVEVY